MILSHITQIDLKAESARLNHRTLFVIARRLAKVVATAKWAESDIKCNTVCGQ